MKSIFSYCLSIFLLINSVLADDIQITNVACNINAISSQAGFEASIYQYTSPQSSYYSDPAFYANGYRSGTVIGSSSGIVNINFDLPGGTQELYGASFDSSNFVVEYMGYFKGMFYFSPFTSFLFHYSC